MRAASIRFLAVAQALCLIVAACSATPVATQAPTPTPTTASSTPASPSTPPTTPSPAAIATASATPSALPSAATPAGPWVLDTTLPEFEVRDALAASGTLIAVGCRVPTGADDCARAAIRVSDGNEWTTAHLDGDTARVELIAVASGPDGYAAVGRDADSGDGEQLDGAAFISADGRTWRRAPDQASLESRALVDVVARPGGGWIAVGVHAGPSHFFGFDTWSSSDGVTWTRTASKPDVGTVRGVTTFAGGLIAWGSDCDDVCGPPERAALWASTDGTSWARVPKQPSLAGAAVQAVVPTTSGVLAIGGTYDADGSSVATGWLSTDGRSWSTMRLRNGAGYGFFRLTLTPGGVVAVGARYDGNDSKSRTWVTTDGSSWSRLPEGDLAAEVPGLAGTAADAVALGRSSGQPMGDTTVWRLRLD